MLYDPEFRRRQRQGLGAMTAPDPAAATAPDGVETVGGQTVGGQAAADGAVRPTRSSFRTTIPAISQPENEPAAIAGEIMGRDSLLMQNARTQGAQFANRRGLLNSSMAGQAAQTAVLEHVVPLASQTADLRNRTGMQEREIAHQEVTQGREIAHQKETQALNLERDRWLAELDAANRVKLQEMQMTSQSRQGAETVLQNAFRDYESAKQSILGNTELPAKERATLLENASRMLEKKMDYITELYGAVFDWPENPFKKTAAEIEAEEKAAAAAKATAAAKAKAKKVSRKNDPNYSQPLGGPGQGGDGGGTGPAGGGGRGGGEADTGHGPGAG